MRISKKERKEEEAGRRSREEEQEGRRREGGRRKRRNQTMTYSQYSFLEPGLLASTPLPDVDAFSSDFHKHLAHR